MKIRGVCFHLIGTLGDQISAVVCAFEVKLICPGRSYMGLYMKGYCDHFVVGMVKRCPENQVMGPPFFSSAGDSSSFQQKRSYMCNNARICSTLPPWWTLTPTLFTHMSPSSESLALVSNEVPKVRETGRNLDIPFTSPQLDARKGTKTAQNRRKYPKSSRKRGKLAGNAPPKGGSARKCFEALLRSTCFEAELRSA